MNRNVMSQWVLSEEILALDLYVSMGRKVASTSSPKTGRISDITGKSRNSVVLKTANFRSLDPESSSKGMENVSELDRRVWSMYEGRWSELSIDAKKIMDEKKIITYEIKLGRVERPSSFYLPDYKSEVSRRIGQNRVRIMALINYDDKCCICGMDYPGMLRASHIVPWKVNPSIRADPSNVICLCAMHDAMFDLGLISVNSSRIIVVCSAEGAYPSLRAALSSIKGKRLADAINKWATPKDDYLKYHFNNVFLDSMSR